MSDGAPAWRRPLTLAVGVVAVAAGVTLMLKPFTSLGALTLLIAAALVVSGVADLVEDARGWSLVRGGLLVVTGVVAVLLPAATIRLVAVVAGIGLIVSGVTALVAGLRGKTGDRYSAVVGGAARFLLGVVALSWPDVTLLVVALLVGPVAIVAGIGLIVAHDRSRRERPLWLRRGWATAALALVVVLVFVSRSLHGAAPVVDDFYAAPSDLPDRPGQLVRSEPFDRGLPAGARAWRILYTTTRTDDSLGVASGLVVVGEGTGPRPVVAWTHGTTGVARHCAPTLLPDPLGAGAMPALDEVLARGWALVATDYLGLGTTGPHPYLVGTPAAHSELDAVRAARQLSEVELADETVAWGHSQGGAAALWTGIESQTYAPDVPLAGVAALAPAADLAGLLTGLQTGLAGKVFGPFVLTGYAATYPDVKVADYVRPAARTMVEQVSTRCLSEPSTLVSAVSAVVTEPIFTSDVTAGALAARLAENTPDRVTGIPTFLGQGLADGLVLPGLQAAFVGKLCGLGQVVDHRTYAGLDHVGIVTAPESAMPADLVAWTEERFAGAPAPTACSTTAR